MFAQLWVPTYALLSGMMADLIGYDPSSGMSGVLRNCYCALFQSGSPAPSKGSTLVTQTEADYDGYARQEVVWFPTYLDVLGPQAVTAANLQFRMTNTTTPNLITQIGLVSLVTGGVLLACSELQTPVQFSALTDQLTTAPVFQLTFNSIYGGPLVWA